MKQSTYSPLLIEDRKIPSGLKRKVLFSGVTMFIGLGFLIIGILFLVAIVIGIVLTDLPEWTALIILPEIIIGYVLASRRYSKNKKSVELLEIGKVAYGQFAFKEPTSVKINGRTVYKMVFIFEVNGKKHRAIAKTHKTENLSNQSEEKLVYNPIFPEDAQLIDELPSAVKEYFENID